MENLLFLGVPILNHIRVFIISYGEVAVGYDRLISLQLIKYGLGKEDTLLPPFLNLSGE